MTNIKIQSFTGLAAKTYIPSISKLRAEIFQDFPFLYENTVQQEAAYLKKFTECSDAIIVVVFDGSQIVGGATGLPLENEAPELLSFLTQQQFPLNDCFCMGESMLLKPYRGRGLGHHFFDLREEHARHLKRFSKSLFCTVSRPENDPKKPSDYVSLENFWKKRGYLQHPDLKMDSFWKDAGDEEPTEKHLSFWIKPL